jgi:hypothetical protein
MSLLETPADTGPWKDEDRLPCKQLETNIRGRRTLYCPVLQLDVLLSSLLLEANLGDDGFGVVLVEEKEAKLRVVLRNQQQKAAGTPTAAEIVLSSTAIQLPSWQKPLDAKFTEHCCKVQDVRLLLLVQCP